MDPEREIEVKDFHKEYYENKHFVEEVDLKELQKVIHRYDRNMIGLNLCHKTFSRPCI